MRCIRINVRERGVFFLANSQITANCFDCQPSPMKCSRTTQKLLSTSLRRACSIKFVRLSGIYFCLIFMSSPSWIGACGMYIVPLLSNMLRVTAYSLRWMLFSDVGCCLSIFITFICNSYSTEPYKMFWNSVIVT